MSTRDYVWALCKSDYSDRGARMRDVQAKVIEYTVSSTCTPVEAYEGDE